MPVSPALVFEHDALDLDAVVGAEAQLVLFAGRQLRELAHAGENAVAEQRHLAGQDRRGRFGRSKPGVEIGSVVEARHGAHEKLRLNRLGRDVQPLRLVCGLDGDAARDVVNGLEGGDIRLGGLLPDLILHAAGGFGRRSRLAGLALPYAACDPVSNSTPSICSSGAAVLAPGRVAESDKATSSQSSPVFCWMLARRAMRRVEAAPFSPVVSRAS